jgi:regulator of sirC expression with transglutaminase-like and TPR domain
LLVLHPTAWAEHRDRGLALAKQGEPGRALIDLETYLANADDALDLDEVADRLADLRRACG